MSPAANTPSDGGSGYEPADVRPVIPTGGSSNMGLWAFLVVLAAGGGALFSALSASREAAEAPSVLQPSEGAPVRIASPAPLDIPDRFATDPRSNLMPADQLARDRPSGNQPLPPEPAFRPQAQAPFRPVEVSASEQLPPVQLQPQAPRVVFDNRASPPPGPLASSRGDEGSARVTAERFVNPSLTIPQGTVIPAVLETALDSTRAGGVRALVQRDVAGFDGSRVLIPRGSRLYGEYEASLQPGQNRALVRWTRLIRPDGVTIALDSPSSDPLGRAGIGGKVDSKFLQRFGGALLQSVLDIGVGVAVNRATDGVIVALPGSTQNVRVTEPQQIQPTLKVKHGTSVSVFVARDLDFSTVDR
ncbi:MAG: TrbI/VirB10 family protein [Erythrobacter sp.]|nr:TrbI/VirB10 family protein [Erythrobacter sp.]MDZ4272676.1 TrbI/VirB10 family protein [Erythrobacter sp.]